MTGTTLVDRAVLRVTGEDVRGFLQGLVTNDVERLDGPVWAGLLTAQGKALFDFMLWPAKDLDGTEDVLIDCEGSQADALARRLSLYRLRRAITIARDEILAVHWSISLPAPFGLSLSKPSPSAQEGSEVPFDCLAGAQDRLRQAQDERGKGVVDPRLADLGHRWLAPPTEPAEGWLAHRLALGVTEGVADLGSDQTLWLECNAAELHGVSFGKGCYVGQENTARMNWRNKVNRRLVVVPADAPGPRTRIHYPELGLAVEHRRVDDLGAALVPDWLKAALSA